MSIKKQITDKIRQIKKEKDEYKKLDIKMEIFEINREEVQHDFALLLLE